jgi:hypothetical protein
MVIWCLYHAYMIVIWCLYDVYMISIWWPYDAYIMVIWCLYDVNMVVIWCLYDGYMVSNVLGRPAGPQSVSRSHLATAVGENRTLTEGKEHMKRANLDLCNVWRASKYRQKALWISTNFDDSASSKNASGSHLDAIYGRSSHSSHEKLGLVDFREIAERFSQYLYDGHMMSIWWLYGAYMMSIWLLYDVYMMVIWCLYHAYMIVIWCLYDVYMISIYVTFGEPRSIAKRHYELRLILMILQARKTRLARIWTRSMGARPIPRMRSSVSRKPRFM